MSVNIHSLSISLPLSPSIHQPHTNSSYGGGAYLMGKLLCDGSCCHLYLCTGVCVCVCVRECICLCLYLLGFVLFILKIRTSIWGNRLLSFFLLTPSRNSSSSSGNNNNNKWRLTTATSVKQITTPLACYYFSLILSLWNDSVNKWMIRMNMRITTYKE